jgi:hypothetical protein
VRISVMAFLVDVLNGDTGSMAVLADWVEEFHSEHPEAELYIKRLRQPTTVRLRTMIDIIIKFGPKEERLKINNLLRRAIRSRRRPNSKGTTHAFMKKRWSLTRSWFITDELRKGLGVILSRSGEES